MRSIKGAADAAACVYRRLCAQTAWRSAEAYGRAPASLGVATGQRSAARGEVFEASWYGDKTVVEAMILVLSVTEPPRLCAAAATMSLAAKWTAIIFVLIVGCCGSCNVPWAGCPPFFALAEYARRPFQDSCTCLLNASRRH